MKKLSIKVTSRKPPGRSKYFCHIGEIIVDGHTTEFLIETKYWGIEDYQRQWRQGIKRIATHNKSCLVISVNLSKYPVIGLWTLHKTKNDIYIQKRLLTEPVASTVPVPPLHTFNTRNCYRFINPIAHNDDNGQ